MSATDAATTAATEQPEQQLRLSLSPYLPGLLQTTHWRAIDSRENLHYTVVVVQFHQLLGQFDQALQGSDTLLHLQLVHNL
jgi:hypothetical protein